MNRPLRTVVCVMTFPADMSAEEITAVRRDMLEDIGSKLNIPALPNQQLILTYDLETADKTPDELDALVWKPATTDRSVDLYEGGK